MLSILCTKSVLQVDQGSNIKIETTQTCVNSSLVHILSSDLGEKTGQQKQKIQEE